MTGRQRDASFALLVVLCAVALAGVLWAWGLPLTNDGTTHVLSAWIWNHYDDPAYGYAKFYDLMRPWTSNGFFHLQRALEPMLGWQTAWRVNVILCAELWAFGFLFFVVALSPGRRVAGLLGFALCLQASLWYGLMPFFVGTALGWFALGCWLRVRQPFPRYAAILGLVSLAAWCHVFAGALTGAALGVFALAMTPRSRWPQILLALLAVGAPALFIAWRSAGIELGEENVRDAEWADLVDRLLCGGVWFQSGPRWRAVQVTALVVLSCVVFARRARQDGTAEGASHSARTAALGIGVLLVLVSALVPFDLVGWQGAGTRGLPLGVGLLLALLPVDAAARSLRLATRAAVALYVVTSLLWSLSFHRAVRAATAPMLAGLDLAPAPRDRAVLQLHDLGSRFPLPRFDPLFNVGNLYTIVLGGHDPYGHHSAVGIHHISVKASARKEAPNLNFWQAIALLEGQERADALRKLLARSSEREGLILAGRPEDAAVALASGFVAEFESPGILIARFEGCAGRVELVGVDAPVEIELGWWPSRVPTEAFTYRPGPGAATTLPLARFGCGDVWLHVRSADGRGCEGLEAGMPVRASFAPGGANVLACRLTAREVAP